MKKALLLICLAVFLFSVPSAGKAHNPFTSKPEKSHKTLSSPVKSEFFLKIVFWQHQLREKMSSLIREAKEEKTILPLFLLCLSAFLYGMVHSAGPGHGKAVALSYILSCKPSLYQGVMFGNLLAITHGCSGIFLVLAVKYLLQTGISQSLESMTYVTQVVSFSFISLMGSVIFIKGIINWLRSPDRSNGSRTYLFTNPFATAVAVGLIPCPGVVMVMLFAISMELTGLGIFLGLCIASGMATTITLIVLAGMSGKAAAINLTSEGSKVRHILENTIEILAGLLVATLGIILLLANL